MTHEPAELTMARDLLTKFQKEMARHESLITLVNALSLLSQVRRNATDEVGQVATQLAATYAMQAQAAVKLLLAKDSAIHGDTLNHWASVLAEFSRYGFALPPELAETQRKLGTRKMNKIPPA